jgi:hypothetical protein
MSRIKLVLLSMLAITAVTALAAATASAALPEFLPTGTKATFTSTSGPGTLEPVGGETIACTADTDKGSITGAKTFAVTISFTGCKAFGFANCTTTGAKTGEIIISGTGTLGFIKATTPLEVGGSVAITETEFACLGLVKVRVRGAAIGVVTPINTSSTTGHLNFTQSKGKQSPLNFEGGATLTFESSKNGGTFEQAGETTEDTITFSEKITVDG